MRNRRIEWNRLRTLMAVGVVLIVVRPILSADDDPHTQIAAVDAGIGPCSLQLSVTDAKGAPVYNAKVRVHIAYGLMKIHKLDLEVGTNSDGKARFNSLPDRVKQPLTFRASEGDREGSVSYAPSKSCPADHDTIVLQDRSKNPD